MGAPMGQNAVDTAWRATTQRVTSCRAGILLALAALLLTFAAAVPAPASAYRASGTTGWTWQNPRPQGNPLACVKFVDASHGWAVGGKGAIVATTDGGSCWRAQPSGTTEHLYGVTFLDDATGWAVGAKGTILFTADGGHSWVPQASGTSIDLRSVCFVDARHGWAVGFSAWQNDTGAIETSGAIVATTDGGATWRTPSPDQNWGYVGASFVDAMNGWVVGLYGEILATADGGATWTQQSQNAASTLRAVAFTDALHGCAVGRNYFTDSRVALVTSDGGVTWRQSYSRKAAGNEDYADLLSVAFSDRAHGWAVGDSTNVLATVDGGETWHKQSRPSGIRYLAQGDAVSVSAVDAQHAWALESSSFDEAGAALLVTSDAGATWDCRGADTFTHFTAVAFADLKHGWAAGYNHLTKSVEILATVNGGVTWRVCLHRDYIRPFEALSAVDAKHCWAAHYSPGIGIIWRTTNGGATWAYTAKSGDWEVGYGDLAFVSRTRGWAVSGGQIRTTGDGGVTWTDQKPATRESMRGAAFINARQGWVVGGSGAVIVTANGGATWRARSSGTRKDLARVAFVDGRHGWAVGAEGRPRIGGRGWPCCSHSACKGRAPGE